MRQISHSGLLLLLGVAGLALRRGHRSKSLLAYVEPAALDPGRAQWLRQVRAELKVQRDKDARPQSGRVSFCR